MKRALDPDVQAVIDETMADWRRRHDTCADPTAHLEWHYSHELTIRRRADGTSIHAAPGICQYCGKRLP